MNSYDGLQRFQNELARNTRETKEALCAISTKISTISDNVSDLNNETGIYNINEQFVLTDTSTITLPANTYHSYSFIIFSGTADITEGGVTLTNAPTGYYGDSSATTLLQNSVVFVGKSAGTKIIIKTIR